MRKYVRIMENEFTAPYEANKSKKLQELEKKNLKKCEISDRKLNRT